MRDTPPRWPRGWMYVLLCICLSHTHPTLGFAGPTPRPPQGQDAARPALTNNDVIQMAQAKLGDAVIVAKVKSSPCKFDTSADALIMLKQAGVSDAVLQAMLEGGEQPPASPPDRLAPSPPSAATPTAYGYYVVEDGQARSVGLVPGTVVIGCRMRMGGTIGVDGLAGDPNVKLKTPLPTFLFYQQSLNIHNLHISTRTYVPSMVAYEFNIGDIKPQFFAPMCGRNYNDTVSVNLWRPQAENAFNVEPVEGKSGMFKITPRAPLKPGRYAAYFSTDIHPGDMIFRTDRVNTGSALYFEVLAADGSSAPSASSGPQQETRQFADLKQLLEQSNALMEKKLYSDAIPLLEQALPLAKGRNTAVVLGRLAQAYGFNKNDDKAAETYLKAAEIDPANASMYYFNCGALMSNQNKMDEAIDAFQKALSANPNNELAEYYLGATLFKKSGSDPSTGKLVPAPGTVEALQTYLKKWPNGRFATQAKDMLQTVQSSGNPTSATPL